ncbi:MAG TPA: SoxR reducing system RseC family protein [Rhodocyclaceae bacterium]|nr:SoxR reducing system RseC family protein [Rhodocyclaceae bacterium]
MQVEAVITRVVGGLAYLRVVQSNGGCGRCDERGGCRSDTLGQMLGPRCREYAVDNVLHAAINARVIVDVADGAPLRAAVLAYLFPLLMMFAGAGLAQLLTHSDLIAFLGAVAGLFAALAILHIRRDRPGFVAMRPHLIKILTD